MFVGILLCRVFLISWLYGDDFQYRKQRLTMSRCDVSYASCILAHFYFNLAGSSWSNQHQGTKTGSEPNIINSALSTAPDASWKREGEKSWVGYEVDNFFDLSSEYYLTLSRCTKEAGKHDYVLMRSTAYTRAWEEQAAHKTQSPKTAGRTPGGLVSQNKKTSPSAGSDWRL